MSEELAKYLKSKKGLNRLIIELKNKYISLGRYSGVVTLKKLTKEESIDISNLLGRRINEGETLKTSYKEITKKILETKYSSFNWEELLNSYFDEKIINKKKLLELNDKNEYDFFQNILNNNKDKIYVDELRKIINEKNELYITLKQRYNKDKSKLESDLNKILLLLNNIPQEPTPLPVYSVITGNPHYLDLNTRECSLFLKFLSYIYKEELPNDNEGKINLLSKINVYTDPISNYVITYKLRGNNVLDELSDNKEIINLNLLNILKLKEIDTKEKKVYIFENPAMLNSLYELDVPIIITSGIPNMSLYKVLEKLENSNNELYYNGDFDPEGLLIADKLKKRFPKLKFFCYEEDDYINSKSKEVISDSRIKKMDRLEEENLQTIKDLLLKNKRSAYQEKNIDRIVKFIKNN